MTDRTAFSGTLAAVLTTAAASLILNILTLHPGHNWGGDFSQYILHAQNLASGRTYDAGIMLDNPVIYPPGFPLLLVPLLKCFGLNFQWLKIWNIIGWYGAIVLLFPVWKRRIGEPAAAGLALIFILSSWFFVMKQNILSDIPFFFLTCAAIRAFEGTGRLTPEQQPASPVGFFVWAGTALLVRSAGIALFLAAAGWFLLRRRWKNVAITGALVITILGLQAVCLPASPGYLGTLLAEPATTLAWIGRQYHLVFTGMLWLIAPALSPASAAVFQILQQAVELLSPLLVGLLCYALLRVVTTRQASFSLMFFLAYCAVLVPWTAFAHSPQSFSRYVLPVTAIGGMYLIRIAQLFYQRYLGERLRSRIAAAFAGTVVLAVAIINGAAVARIWPGDDDVLRKPAQTELLDWMNRKMPVDARYLFWNPRPLALMTGRTGITRWSRPGDRTPLNRRLDEFSVQYCILDREIDADVLPYWAGQPSWKNVWSNRRYVIYELAPGSVPSPDPASPPSVSWDTSASGSKK